MGSDTFGVSALQPHFRGPDCMQFYGDAVPDQAKCPHYRRWLHFRGVHKAGFHCYDLHMKGYHTIIHSEIALKDYNLLVIE